MAHILALTNYFDVWKFNYFAFNSLQHLHLIERPLDLVYKRGTIFQRVSSVSIWIEKPFLKY